MSKDDEMIAALRQRRGPSKALLFGGIGGVLVIGIVAAVVLGRGSAESSRAWSAFSRCMIGEPLAENENVFFRIRSVELGKQLQPDGEGDAAWPNRCATHATSLFRSIDGSGESALLQRLLREQLGCGDAENEPCKFPSSGQPLTKADETWKAAKLAGLELVDVPEVAPPKASLKPLFGREWPSLGSATLVLADHRFTESGELWLLFEPGRESKAAFRWCKLSPSGEKASCADLASLPRSLEDAHFLDDDRSPSIVGRYEAEAGEERGAFRLADGKAQKARGDVVNGSTIERRGDELYLLAVENGLVVAQNELEVPELADVSLFAGWAGWFELDEKEKKRHLRWRKVAAGAKLEGDPVELSGEIPPRVEPCAAPGGGVIHGRTGNTQSAWFLNASGWSEPVTGSLPGGQRRDWTPLCAPDRLTRSWVATAGDKVTIGALECTPKGCSQKQTEWKGGKVKQWLAVGQLGAATLVLYETYADDKRLKLAPLDRLNDTQPVLLMDGFEYSGPKFERPRVMIGPKLSVVLFDDEKDLHALYVNAEGKYGVVSP